MGNFEIITNSIGLEMVLIPSGTFLMGSPTSEKFRCDNEIQHQVTLSKPFYTGCTVVTQRQWIKVMGNRPWEEEEYVEEGDDYPAVNISWDDANEFCRKLSASDGKSYRLPTEAEWEYACRGGTDAAYSFGDSAKNLTRYAWFEGNSRAVGEKYAHRVALKHPNPFGLYDMHGNVWEWCSDWYGDYPCGSLTDPLGPKNGFSRVLRGGQWGVGPGYVRSASRNNYAPEVHYNVVGFRLVSD